MLFIKSFIKEKLYFSFVFLLKSCVLILELNIQFFLGLPLDVSCRKKSFCFAEEQLYSFERFWLRVKSVNLLVLAFSMITARKVKFSIKDLFSKCDQIRWKLRIWSHLLKKPFMENFIFCAVDL